MEILSTGEKIKRARIYKGFTLRELCEDKISVSKMSCIENNKIKPEPWILEYISKKLDIEFEYLQKDIKDHLDENYEMIKKNIGSDKVVEEIIVNLEYAESCQYYDTAIKLIHVLSKKYLEQKNEEELKNIQCKYYELYEKVCTKENQALYFADLADYLQLIKQYEQAANYYKSVRLLLMKSKKEEKMSFDKNTMICEMIYGEAICYFLLKQYKKSYDVLINNEIYI
ncbi:Helix-turn-helix domain-containing protein [Hathewaya proteolytica DSM 3090]|uniref:Helix-turn-helix domain-containing protein n=1 Tax=Hathewaya proteolytica DSM 3090 TaxID=1121331 RepID=A0A1M6KMC4_9CLOT|nr:helix-turn-helix transcriptional regulator [Hathewaya proteolytica]SHJ59994.1 Helix-turn-helix domain-containing protein [Hathewaya proteolytica DSM 3090]